MQYVNDAHCQVSRTRVRSVLRARSKDDIHAAIDVCKTTGCSFSTAGGRFALGRQAFGTGGVLLDLQEFNSIMELDEQSGVIRFQGGVRWPQIRGHLRSRNSTWEIHQKQTGADNLSVAGSISVNAHGNPLRSGPLSNDIDWFTLITSDGQELRCSRSENRELFSLATGGMGLFGVISEIGLRLVRSQVFVRSSKLRHVEELAEDWESMLADNDYGDMQLDINPQSPHFLTRGVLNLWRPTSASAEMSASPIQPDWGRLITLAHCDKPRAFDEYVQYASAVDDTLNTRDHICWDSYTPGYHRLVEQALGLPSGGELLAEFFIPQHRLLDLLHHMRESARESATDLILATLRSIRQCDVSFMRWARSDYVCVVLAMHVNHQQRSLAAADRFCCELAEYCVSQGGNYYLPYRCLTSAQTLRDAYPAIDDFFTLQSDYDRARLFRTDWSSRLRQQLGLPIDETRCQPSATQPLSS